MMNLETEATVSADDERRAIEQVLYAHLPDPASTPAVLSRALRDAVTGGKRLRGRLVLRTASACHASDSRALLVACAVEMVHAASLVHDDLPCFDDAATRRGRPSVHAAHGVPAAVLTGDALIVQAFGVLAGVAYGARLCSAMSAALSAERGLIGGQACELEPAIDLSAYHSAKTAALYRFACTAGALLGGDEQPLWGELGERAGRIAQVLDDYLDVHGDAAAVGKPVGRDQSLKRPNLFLADGSEGARRVLFGLLDETRSIADALGPRGRKVGAWIEWELRGAV